jgi:prepilin signal peptidase PulO-like enzyme (type II secretory pathway)
LIFIIGITAGLIITAIALNIANINQHLESEPGEVKVWSKFRWVKLTPAFTGFISLFAWLQPPYQHSPPYIFVGNLILIWILILIAIVDWLTHQIFPLILLNGTVITGFILIAVSFFEAIVGLETDKTTGIVELENAKNARVTDPNFIQLWPLGVYDSLIGAITAGLVFGLLYLISRLVYKKEVFGSGDVLLAIFVGFMLGFERTIFAIPGVVLISLVFTFSILLLQRKQLEGNLIIPFGPFICLSAILCFLYNPSFTIVA